jgi:ssDNA-binding Zn-finger/Zn-ribbon topoisomerase 1
MQASGTVTQGAAALQCPKCGAAMRTRRGSRGEFLGCVNYPTCTGSRSLAAEIPAVHVTPLKTAPVARPEVPGPTGALITDLREAAGHLGRAIDLLRRRQPEIDQLLDARDGITF